MAEHLHSIAMKPFFSVVIPTYNRAEKLKRTIDSVVSQTFSDFEILVMDDGSTDGTRAMMGSPLDARIRYEWASNSGGPATPRNRGIDLARADWICFLDADDLWHPGKLERTARAIRECPTADLFCHDVVSYMPGSDRKSVSKCGPFEKELYRVMLLEGNQVITSATTVRRDFLNRHALRFNTSSDYVIVEDFDLWLRVALNGGRFRRIREPLGDYLLGDDSISADLTRSQRNLITLLREHVYQMQSFEPDKDRLWRELNSYLAIELGKSLIANRQLVAGVRSLIHGCRGTPVRATVHIVSRLIRRIRKAMR